MRSHLQFSAGLDVPAALSRHLEGRARSLGGGARAGFCSECDEDRRRQGRSSYEGEADRNDPPADGLS